MQEWPFRTWEINEGITEGNKSNLTRPMQKLFFCFQSIPETGGRTRALEHTLVEKLEAS